MLPGSLTCPLRKQGILVENNSFKNGRVMLKRCVLVAAFFAFAASTIAQSYLASVRGTILDQAGAPVPGVVVHVINEGTGESRSATTSPENGRYTISSLPPGTYRVEA